MILIQIQIHQDILMTIFAINKLKFNFYYGKIFACFCFVPIYRMQR